LKKSSGSSKLATDLILKETKEIRAFLDHVIGQDQTKSNVGVGLQSLQTFNATNKTMK
jgi:hypothetical protein